MRSYCFLHVDIPTMFNRIGLVVGEFFGLMELHVWIINSCFLYAELFRTSILP